MKIIIFISLHVMHRNEGGHLCCSTFRHIDVHTNGLQTGLMLNLGGTFVRC